MPGSAQVSPQQAGCVSATSEAWSLGRPIRVKANSALWQMSGWRRGAVAASCPDMRRRGMQRYDGVQFRYCCVRTNAEDRRVAASRVVRDTWLRAARGDLPEKRAEPGCRAMMKLKTCDGGEPERGSHQLATSSLFGKGRKRPARRRAGAGRELRRSLGGHHDEGRLVT